MKKGKIEKRKLFSILPFLIQQAQEFHGVYRSIFETGKVSTYGNFEQ